MMETKCYDCDRLPTARQREICRGEAEMLPNTRAKYLERWLAQGLIAEVDCSSVPLREPKEWTVKQRSRGAGDTVAKVIHKATFGMVKPCGGCKERQGKLNRMVPFGRKSKPSKVKRTVVRRSSSVQTQVTTRRGHPFAYKQTDPLEFVTTCRFTEDVKALASMLPADTSHIVGIARSGLFAATLVSMLLHRPLLIARRTHEDLIEAGNGWRLSGNVTAKGPAVVIDDTTMTGSSFRRIMPIVQKRFPDAISASVYVNPAATNKPALWVRELPWPHLLEWNLFNSILTPSMALDFDGILCRDCPTGDDDGPRYLKFLAETKPLYPVRKVTVPLIVTARLEKYRPQTMDWLARHGIRVAELVMGPWATHAERTRSGVIEFKAGHYQRFLTKPRRIKPSLFVESDSRQAEEIARLSGGVVVCPAAGRCYQGREAAMQSASVVRPRSPVTTRSISGMRRKSVVKQRTINGAIRWVVGITTAPRVQPTLARTLASLAAVGFENPVVFAEPGVDPLSDCRWNQNEKRLGAWQNFIHAARYLSTLECDAILLCQDDVVFASGLRTYVESSLWPQCGAMSLYASEYHVRKEMSWGWHAVQYRNLVGALAFVAKPELLARLVKSRQAKSKAERYIDALFGRWIASNGGLLFHAPSLAQHIGDTSVIHPGAPASGSRHANTFVGEDYDLTVRIG